LQAFLLKKDTHSHRRNSAGRKDYQFEKTDYAKRRRGKRGRRIPRERTSRERRGGKKFMPN